MMRNAFIISAFIGLAAACRPTETAQAPSGPTTTVQSTAAARQFGAPVDAAGAISYTDLVGRLETGDTLAVKVQGTVNAVCQKKGCWMNLTGPDAAAAPMMVRFKDYGFFVPMDISGREVVIDGKAFYKVVPVDELRHYAEDAGKSEAEIAAITEPKRELNFEAAGVLLLD